MDKIAIISDIHGNIPALEAVLQDIKSRGIERIICLGDLAGKGPSTEVAVDMVKASCETVLKGNWDYLISSAYNNEIFLWHHAKLRKDQLQYLGELPVFTEFYMSGRLIRLSHAAPFDVFCRVFGSAAVEEKMRLFKGFEGENLDCDVVGYGDLHGAFVQNFNGKTLINVGSVGNPLEITQASYGILEGQCGTRQLSSFAIALIRVPYDVEKSILQARETDMPDLEQYINELRTAVYRGRKS